MSDEELQAIDEIQDITIDDMLGMSDEEIRCMLDSTCMVLDTIEPRMWKKWNELPDAPDIPDDVRTVPGLNMFAHNVRYIQNDVLHVPMNIVTEFMHLETRFNDIKSNIRKMNVFLASERDPVMILGLQSLGY